MTFDGTIKFEKNAEPQDKTNVYNFILARQEGGAITSFQSMLYFNGETSLSENEARNGGALYATESKVFIYGNVTIANSKVTVNSSDSGSGYGGGIYLYQSDFMVSAQNSTVILFNNLATKGGGIYVRSSLLTINQYGSLCFLNNTAVQDGGGIFSEGNMQLNLLKTEPSCSYNNSEEYFLIFSGNSARSKGGAIFIDDVTSSRGCFHDTECFIQVLVLHPFDIDVSTPYIQFEYNSAPGYGSDIYGGLFDRCIPSPFSIFYKSKDCSDKPRSKYNRMIYLQNISKISESPNSIGSLPVKLRICNDNQSKITRYIKKGGYINVSVVALDQANNFVDATITGTKSI